MREFIRLIESADIRDEDDDAELFGDNDEKDWSHLKSSSLIKTAIPKIVAAAQKQYNRWQIIDDDEIGFQDEYAGGGICHLIADDISNIIGNLGIPCTTVSSSHEQHVYCVAQCEDGVFEIDIPYRSYETGGGYTWERIPGVTFDADYVSIHRLDYDPGKMAQYCDEWEDE